MSLAEIQAPPPAITPISSDFQRDLAQHVKSVRHNEIKSLQLRPTLESCDAQSTPSFRSSISPPPVLRFPRAILRGKVTYNTFADLESPFIDLSQPHQTSIMTKNGIFNLYVSHAQEHIEHHETSGTVSKISRARVELELLAAIDEGVFPIEYKLCWVKAVLSSSNFESFWLDKARSLKLSASSIERYNPSESLLEYEAATPPESEPGSPRRASLDSETVSKPNRGRITQLPTPQTEGDEHEEDEDFVPTEAAAFARLLGGSVSSAEEVPISDPRYAKPDNTKPQAPPHPHAPSHNMPTTKTPSSRTTIGVDLNGLARETGDDGAWGSPPKTKTRTKTSKSKTPQMPRAAPSTPVKARTPKKGKVGNTKTGQGVKRGFTLVTDEVGPHGTPPKKVKKNTADHGTSGAGRQRKKTEKMKAILPGQC